MIEVFLKLKKNYVAVEDTSLWIGYRNFFEMVA